ncbi:RNase A-like domain-containing protein [Pseudomonas sp. EL_65y_Pfl1_R83]|uniref:RNase A-like domain-containing protein n=1 Tax=Pseudomonas sp. EL_65y_Pfl1_R83 TaxID=3088697 RepID=UPI00403FBDCB
MNALKITATRREQKIKNNNQIVIAQKTKYPVGTSIKKDSTRAVSGKEIYLIIRRDHNMHTGCRIHTGFPNP